ncbi:MAG: ammonium transporter [Pseudomonadota bacterium]
MGRICTPLRVGGAVLAIGLALTIAAPSVAHAQTATTAAAATTTATTTDTATTAAPAAAEAAPAAAPVAEAPKIDSGDTAWMLTSSLLVLMMTVPGLALFYAGMVRKKNILATLAQSFGATCVITVAWMVVGYSIAFTANPNAQYNSFIGGLNYVLLAPMGLNSTTSLAPTIPESVYMFFQMTFAIITPALIAGALADRMKYSAFLLFMFFWLILVYCPIAHWVWGGGWLGSMGALDYAGGTVVHLNAGTAGLVAALMLGKRKGLGHADMAPYNLAYSVIGASLLWVGWFGFNAGSAVTSNVNAGMAAAATQIATAAAGLTWMIVEWILKGKPSVLGMISGAVAGLVAITPASGFVDAEGALIIGIGVGIVCFIAAVYVKKLFGYDDALDCWGVHGIGGAFGAIMTGLLAKNSINSLAHGALFDGNWDQMRIQAIDVGGVFGYCLVVTFIILLVLKFTVGIRVSEAVEEEGLDVNLHGEVVQG